MSVPIEPSRPEPVSTHKTGISTWILGIRWITFGVYMIFGTFEIFGNTVAQISGTALMLINTALAQILDSVREKQTQELLQNGDAVKSELRALRLEVRNLSAQNLGHIRVPHVAAADSPTTPPAPDGIGGTPR